MKDRAPVRLFALASALALALVLAGCHRADFHQTLRSQRFQAPSGGPELLAVYQPWFGDKEHIDVGYSSQDQVVLEKQIQSARNIGIAGFLVNWYGPRKEFMDHSYALLQQVAAQQHFKVAIQYDEDVANPGHETDAVIVDLQYAYDRYISPESGAARSAYLRYNGRPVIFIFPKTDKTDWNRVRRVANSWPDPPLLFYKDINPQYLDAFDGFYAWVQPGGQGWSADGRNWGQDYLEDFYSRMKNKHPDKMAIGAAWPGFNDKQASWSRHRFMNTRCGKTFEDSLRVFRRYYNDAYPLPFLLIETWNDYEEGTAIENGLATCSNDGGRKSAMTSDFTSPGQR